MNAKKILAMFLALCLMLGCMSVTALAEAEEPESIALGKSKTVSVEADGGEYIDVYLNYSFTPEESGTYAFYVEYDEEVSIWHSTYVTAYSDIDAAYSDSCALFNAEAGVPCELEFNYWGEYTESIDYVLTVEKCQPVENIELELEDDVFYAGGYTYIHVYCDPVFHNKDITWTFSDPTVAELDYAEADYASVCLLEPGTLTITATAGSGASASVEIEVVEPVVPVAMEITKAPDNTAILSSVVDSVYVDTLMAGMEMEVTWSDGSTTSWSYDEEGSWIGDYYLDSEIVDADDSLVLVIYLNSLSAEIELTVLDLTVESFELVDDSPLQVVENSCGVEFGENGWMYLPLQAYNREVLITFDDGSTVTAKPGDVVYGIEIGCDNSQMYSPWVKDGENYVAYSFGNDSENSYVLLPVEIVDSPVESIELATLPEDTFMIDEDLGLIAPDGETVQDFRQLLEGLSLTVNYKDGTSKTFAEEDIEWVDFMGIEFPFVDGYPLGILGGWLLSWEAPVAPCEVDGYVEYMGVSTTYTIYIVEEFEDDEDDTEDPGQTEDPSNTEDPGQTDDPGNTEKPNETEKPGTTEKPEVEEIPKTADAGIVVLLTAVLFGCLSLVAVVIEKKKLF